MIDHFSIGVRDIATAKRFYDASLKPLGVSDAAVDLVGALRWPEQPGWFVASYSQRQDLWFVRNPLAMAARYGWGEVAPFYIEQEAPVPPGGLPHPAPLKVRVRNDHLQYAITWYGLAAVLVVMFAIWAGQRRRQENR